VIELIVSGVIIASRGLNGIRKLIANRLNTKKQRMPGRKKIAHIKTGIERIAVKKIVMVYQCRNYGDVNRIKGAVDDALENNTPPQLDNLLGSKGTVV